MAIRSFYLIIGNQASFMRNAFKWLLIIFAAALLIGIIFFHVPWIALVVLIPAWWRGKFDVSIVEDYEYAADSYKRLTINTNDRYLKLDEIKLFFNNIGQIDVEYEKTDIRNEIYMKMPLTKARLIFTLNDGHVLSADVQNRRVLLKIVDMLKPYIKITHVDNLRDSFADAVWWALIIIPSFVVIFIIYLLISSGTH